MITRKPEFICLGTQKAGTTTLHDILKQHKGIFLPKIKEAPFFNEIELYAKGTNWWLKTYFKEQKKDQVIGVFSPDYLYAKNTADRIKETYAGQSLKLIIILRHPCDRAYSHYIMSKRRGIEPLSFVEAINHENERLTINTCRFNELHFSYIDRGRYLRQIETYLNFIDQKDILFLSFERDIKTNLDTTIKRIQQFIGVEQMDLNTNIQSNAASATRSKSLQNYLKKELFIKKIGRVIFSDMMRYRMRNRIDQLNLKKMKSETKLAANLRTEMFERYYAKELNELINITGLDLKYWQESE